MTEILNLPNIALTEPTEGISPIALQSRRRCSDKSPASGLSGPAKPDQTTNPEPRATKTSLVIALLCREQGASIDELVTATGWLPHTTRAALSGLRKKGHVVNSKRVAGLSHYRIASVA